MKQKRGIAIIVVAAMAAANLYADAAAMEEPAGIQQIGTADLRASDRIAEKTLEKMEDNSGLVLFSKDEGSAETSGSDLKTGSENDVTLPEEGEESVTGEDVEPVTENPEAEEQPDAIIEGSQTGTSVGNVTLADTNKVTLTYSRTIHYESYKTHYFRARCSDGTHVAYCVQPSVAVAERGTYRAVKGNGPLLTKALYYSYGYPGYGKKMKSYLAGQDRKFCYKGDDGAYALCHIMLSYIYDSKRSDSDAFTGVGYSTRKLVKKMVTKVESWPSPPTSVNLKLSPSKVKAGWKQSIKRQVTPIMKLTGTKGNTITVRIPQYTTMIRKSGNKIKSVSAGSSTAKTMTVTSGQSFYFTAPASKQGVFTSPSMKGSIQAFRPYFIKVKGKQDIVYGLQKNGSVSFRITWLKFGRLELTKKSAKEDITSGNPQYSLEGARYVLLDKNGNKMGTLTTDAAGKASLGTIPFGEYTLKETKASQGFALDTQSYSIRLQDETERQEVPEKPLVPKIRTTAEDRTDNVIKDSGSNGSTGSTADVDSIVHLVDKVRYWNLIPGKTYQVQGVFINKATGKEIPGARASRTFTPDKSSGTIEVDFAFDGSGLEGSTVVAFEKLYLVDEKTGEKYEEASHEDIEDEAQSVLIRKPQRPPEKPQENSPAGEGVAKDTPSATDSVSDAPADTPSSGGGVAPADHSPATGDSPPYLALALALMAAVGIVVAGAARRS